MQTDARSEDAGVVSAPRQGRATPQREAKMPPLAPRGFGIGSNVLNKLITVLKGKILLLGMGNPLRGDDGFGLALARKIKDCVSLKVLEVEDAPENYLGVIAREKPDTILFVDTADFGGSTGELKLWDFKRLKTNNFFLTHNPSPRLLCDFLKEITHAKIYLLAVQPKDTGFAKDISSEINKRLNEAAFWFMEKYPKKARTKI